MNKKFSLTNILGWGLLICLGLTLAFRAVRFVVDFGATMLSLKDMKFYPEIVPARLLRSHDGLSLLWDRNLVINKQNLGFTQFFTPDDTLLVYLDEWKLIALNIETGESLWTVETNEYSSVQLYQNTFFILSPQQKSIMDAPVVEGKVFPDCNRMGVSTLKTYHAQTGQNLWEYTYEGVGSWNNIQFDGSSAYLEGSNDHGESTSIVELELNSGMVLMRDCNQWPAKRKIVHPPENEGIVAANFYPIMDENDWQNTSQEYIFAVEGSNLAMYASLSKELKGKLQFDGAELNPFDVDIVLVRNVLVVYLSDSDQIFSFRLE